MGNLNNSILENDHDIEDGFESKFLPYQSNLGFCKEDLDQNNNYQMSNFKTHKLNSPLS